MSNQRDDKATVVLNLEALKKEQQVKDNELKEVAEGLEFTTGADAPEASVLPVVLFDFKSELFENSLDLFPKDFKYKIITTLPELNNEIKDKSEKIIFFNYSADPASINKLLSQIKAKFTHVKTVVVAKNLSPEKAAQHKATPSGAQAYVSLPFQTPKLKSELDKLN